MNHDYNPEGLARPSLAYLDEELIAALELADTEVLEGVLLGQEKNAVTTALSNHLMARTFMVRQKGRVVTLGNRLANGAKDDEIIGLTQELISTLKDDYQTTFVAVDGKDRYEKLSGDEAFREFMLIDDAMGVDDEDIDNEDFISSVTMAKWRLVETSTTSLESPKETYGWMKGVEESIIRTLYGIVEEINRGGITEQNVFWIEGEIVAQIDSLDANIRSYFQEV